MARGRDARRRRAQRPPHPERDERDSAWTRALLGAAESVSAGAAGRTPIRWALDRALRTAADPAAMARVQRGLEDFEFPSTRLLPTLPPTPPNILHLHNLHGGYFDIRALPELTAQLPTILTMHDVWPLTGHCAYPLTCERWRTGCGDCPDLALPIPIRRDASAENCRIKREALSAGGRLRVATPSRWLMGLVEASGLADSLAELRVIPNGVDTDVYSPRRPPRGPRRARPPARCDDRAVLGALGQVEPVQGVRDARGRASPHREGGRGPRSAARRPWRGRHRRRPSTAFPCASCPSPRIRRRSLATTGPPTSTCTPRMPRTSRSRSSRRWPAACRWSRATPEAFRRSSWRVRPGRLFANGDAEALAAAATALLGDPDGRARMAQAGRERILREFTLDRQVDSYLSWYEEILGR